VDIGAKDRRQLKLTDDARRYFLDERPEVHAELMRKFALKPAAFANLWDRWKSAPPSDPIARSTLKIEFGYPENAAAELLTLYKTNLAFAKLADRANDSPVAMSEASAAGASEPTIHPSSATKVRVGDHVHWLSGGVEQFDKPRRVNWLSDDGSHARVFGSMTGIPTSELIVVDPPKPSVAGQANKTASSAYAGQDGELNVLLRGNRLEITADVDRAGLARLKEILGKYEEILELIDPGQTEPV
jgi:hypothetical protein